MSSIILFKLIFILVIFGVSLFIAMYATYMERKVAAFLQDRIGPNRAGPFGLLQPLADGGKLFFKEEFIPLKSDRWLFLMGPSYRFECRSIIYFWCCFVRRIWCVGWWLGIKQ